MCFCKARHELDGTTAARPVGRNLGEDLLPEPLRGPPKPTETDTLAFANSITQRWAACVTFVRDEEVAGPNPVTPTPTTDPNELQ